MGRPVGEEQKKDREALKTLRDIHVFFTRVQDLISTLHVEDLKDPETVQSLQDTYQAILPSLEELETILKRRRRHRFLEENQSHKIIELPPDEPRQENDKKNVFNEHEKREPVKRLAETLRIVYWALSFAFWLIGFVFLSRSLRWV